MDQSGHARNIFFHLATLAVSPPQDKKEEKITFFLVVVVVVSAPHCADAMRRIGGRGPGQASPYCLEHSLCVYVTSLWLLIPPVEEKVSRRPQQQQQQKRSNKSISAISPLHFLFFFFLW